MAKQKQRTLTVEELRTLWEKYKRGMKRPAMLQLFGITEAQCMEALQAAEAIWGRGPYRTKYKQPAEQAPAPAPASKRPPAVYSNRSPYGIAQPGLGD
jgi:hypothetical protein